MTGPINELKSTIEMSLFVKGAIEMSYNASWFKSTLKPNFFNAPGG
jgi:hypothetical protein